ncbi:S1-like domain-containing RNA-binding protein [Croceitalea sp. MTPC5]|uniref:CvfB family protein n=1 Tax=Croceitalea sp. MTPC5 TaxID=3056565 RepID=UPI002B373C2C|nr:S1-like domain-containing RNA-binding protein [Croceitalea sp. MTPC5]
MIQLGNYNELTVNRSTSVGVFLEDDDGTEILLPNKYVPENVKLDEKLTVFCYLDSQERPVSTTLKPFIIRNSFAFLKVVEVNSIGAFLDWGLEKHLFVPYREQRVKMEAGRWYVVYCYLDEQSFRLTASSKIDKFLSNEEISVKYNDEVEILVSRKTELGWEVIIGHKHKGLLFFDEVFRPIAIGDTLKGYIKRIREDKKIDISLQALGSKMLDATASLIYKKLLEEDGFLPLHDKSLPEEIKRKLQLSKKAFKKGVGVLYKDRKITIQEDGIRLINN